MPSITAWKCSAGRPVARGRRQRAPRATGCSGVAGEGRVDLAPPPRELEARHGRVAHLVDDVVHLAAERVERGDRAPARRRQEEEAVVEARPARGGLLLAVLVRAHWTTLCADALRGNSRSGRPGALMPSSSRAGKTARHATAAQSTGPRTGRRRNTSPCTRSIRARMRRPPAMTRGDLEAQPRRQRGEQRAPGVEQRAGARRSRRP